MDYVIHGERVVDGDASVLAALTLYEMGSPNTARTLTGTERLHITDVLIMVESAADVILVADSEAAGRYIVSGGIAAGKPLVVQFRIPYICAKATIPKFAGGGAQAGRSMCIIHGFIRES